MRRKRDMMRNSRPATNPRPDASPSRNSGTILLPQRLLLVELLVIDKRLGILGGDWRFGIGGDPVYRTQDHEFRITLLCAFALEKSTQDRNVAEAGNFVPDIRDPVIDQTRNYETLTILQLEFGFRFASAQGGNREAGNCQSVGEIQSADFRCDNKVNVPLGMITGVNSSFTPNSLKEIVTAVNPAPGWTIGKGNWPPARKLAFLPLTAMRLGSARIWRRFLLCRASITVPK